jgi:pimeloyl-ACP methyl ester carboxylesterase
MLVDVLPGLKARRSQHIGDFVNGPASFASLDELLERTIAFNPSRSRSSLRRGIVHNAQQQPDGTWVWRWARHRGPAAPRGQAATGQAGAGQAGAGQAGAGPASPAADGTRYAELWAPLAEITVPLLLVRGICPDSVLDDDDERELRRRVPPAQVVHVAEAGHSVQGDAPLEFAAIIEDFVFSGRRERP